MRVLRAIARVPFHDPAIGDWPRAEKVERGLPGGCRYPATEVGRGHAEAGGEAGDASRLACLEAPLQVVVSGTLQPLAVAMSEVVSHADQATPSTRLTPG